MSAAGGGDVVARVARDTAIAVAVLAALAAAILPGRPRVALGVVGGGLLVGLSFWAIRGGVDGILARAAAGGPDGAEPRGGRGWALVKVFTRHAILAAAAYGMMVRLHLDPVGMLVGVSAIVAAAAAEAIRAGLGPGGPGRGR
ncbi:MAG: hypothetical protein AB7H88_18765 [Vicinamibacterales bacterium]